MFAQDNRRGGRMMWLHLVVKDNPIREEKYVVQARRHIIVRTSKIGILGHGAVNTSVLKGSAEIQIVPEDEVKPKFGTPCKYITVGKIQVKLT
jgi:hypothetical protein